MGFEGKKSVKIRVEKDARKAAGKIREGYKSSGRVLWGEGRQGGRVECKGKYV